MVAPTTPEMWLSLDEAMKPDYVDVRAYARFCEQKLDEYEQEREELLATIDTLKSSEEEILTLRWYAPLEHVEVAIGFATPHV